MADLLIHSIVMAHTLETAGEYIVSGIPAARIGTPEDVAGTALFLASRAGAYINGATIKLDGGKFSPRPSHTSHIYNTTQECP
jgi:NAD(P)-dependent dehydrogenase (short-subunit alcohol dehydrogenase family)